MKILVYNFKGGVGKTAFSLAYALEKDFGVVTNDTYSPLEKVLPEDRVLKLSKAASVPDFPADYDIVFDFGGYIDQRVIEAAKMSDWVVIPTAPDFIELQVTLETIKEVERYNKRIVIVANKLGKDDLEHIQEVIGAFFDYPVFPVKNSRLFGKIFEERKSISAIAGENGLARYTYRAIIKQFNKILEHIG